MALSILASGFSPPKVRTKRSRVENSEKDIDKRAKTLFLKKAEKALTASSSSRPRLVSVEPPKKQFPDDLLLSLMSYVGEPHITSRVCKLWKQATLEAYKEILVSWPRDQYSLTLLKLATKRQLKDGVLTPAKYQELPDAICRDIYKSIQSIKDETLILFFNRIKDEFPKQSLPLLPTGVHREASLLRKWMSANRKLFDKITSIESHSGRNRLELLPPEIDYLVNLRLLKISYHPLAALHNNIGNLDKLKYLYLRSNQLAALPEDFNKLKNLKCLELEYNYFSVDQLHQIYAQFPAMFGLDDT